MTQPPTLAVQTICIDCSDAPAMSRFYSGLLGWEPTFSEPEWVLMRNPAGGTGLSFQAEPNYQPPVWPEEPEAQQKMLHLDVKVTPSDGRTELSADEAQDVLDAAAQVALEAGGRLADHQPREDLRIILDPAGHPLCLFL